jgi:hypothetical protein
MSLKSTVRKLANFAKHNEERAFALLGARPGPGTDLLIIPHEPLCGKWSVQGLTKCGALFVAKFWWEQPLSNQKIAEMRKQANEWGLTYRTQYTVATLED